MLIHRSSSDDIGTGTVLELIITIRTKFTNWKNILPFELIWLYRYGCNWNSTASLIEMISKYR